jgi:general secretion pathway protein K
MARERGVALVTVLVVVAVLSGILADLVLSNRLWMRRVESGMALSQAREAVRGAQPWVGAILLADDAEYDARTDPWARTIPPLPVKWGQVSGSVRDLQGRFNLNALVNDKGKPASGRVERFRRLLRILELEPRLADAVVDWLDANRLPQGGVGAEDSYYMGLDPAYAPANRPMHEAAELRLVRGVTGEVWRTLEPHVTALPEATGVNVNTATPAVLAAMMPQQAWGSPRRALARAQTWAERTDSEPFTDLDQAEEALLEDTDGDGGFSGLTVSSDFFGALLEARFDQVRYRLFTVYHRTGKGIEIIRHRREWL